MTREQNPDTTVTIAHEKLIEAWPWLRQLVDDNREAIALQNQIRADAKAWSGKAKMPVISTAAAIHPGGRKAGGAQPSLDDLSQRFIAAGIAAREARAEAEAERIREQEALTQERANAGRFRRLTRWLSIAAVIAVMATIIALSSCFWPDVIPNRLKY